MDDPRLEADRRVRALRALRRVNRVSFAAARVWAEVARIHATLRRPVRVLDIACGGGDVLVDVARRARRTGTPVELHGCDVSAVALAEARRQGAKEGALDVFELDAVRDDLPPGYDLLTTSLFLHHLSREGAVDLLRRMATATGESLLVQDLRRTRLGYLFAWIGLHALTRSHVARSDGLVSVRSAFTVDEVAGMCGDAGLSGAEIGSGWPQRFTVHWRRA
jgi:2-polyprenyl-3-methyl-5-hydroxy-6-metoxy-1,4-benzoquinol methylase